MQAIPKCVGCLELESTYVIQTCKNTDKIMEPTRQFP